MSSSRPAAGAGQDDDDEDDYMKMTFTDEAPLKTQPETSLQRRLRERREAENRGRVKSKAELAAEETAQREAKLSQSLLDSESSKKSKGLAMMAKMGFKPGNALGASTASLIEPIGISVKEGREGIGLESDRKRKLREAAAAAGEATKRAKVGEDEYRDRIRREREEARLQGQIHGAQKVAERLDEERWGANRTTAPTATERKAGRTALSRPLKYIPIVWRGMVRAREEAERDRRMRHDLEQSSSSRLPKYEDEDEDEDDKVALGKAQNTYAAAEDDLDDEDAELDEFNALPASERLQRLVNYLRTEHHYCFWCKFSYPDVEMEGCPGLTEEDHD
ncbi:G-patch domain-containing protein [Podospora didyma]|uniref:G-patch domain-containing protein n=1 Tax=Podospora didyma TaxID=330526 RepID=A0AAE0KAI1_9PEZI|nr:G-patch domain-containing protein [Podospora didyma]